jgi:hypothetical protein
MASLKITEMYLFWIASGNRLPYGEEVEIRDSTALVTRVTCSTA